MARLESKKVQEWLTKNPALVTNVELCGVLKDELNAQASKKGATGKLADLYTALQQARKAYDDALSAELYADKDYSKAATLAMTLGMRELEKRFQHNNLESWFVANHEDDKPFVYSVANVSSLIIALYEQFKKTAADAAKVKKIKESRAERIARLKAELAAAEAEESGSEQQDE